MKLSFLKYAIIVFMFGVITLTGANSFVHAQDQAAQPQRPERKQGEKKSQPERNKEQPKNAEPAQQQRPVNPPQRQDPTRQMPQRQPQQQPQQQRERDQQPRDMPQRQAQQQQEQHQRIQQQRTNQYEQQRQQQDRLAQQREQRLRQQSRQSHMRFQQQYIERVRQDQINLRNARAFEYSAPSFRYLRGGRYYQTNQYGVDMLRRALNYGYEEGYRAGQADREDRVLFSYRDSYAYQDAMYGYDGYQVDLSEYRYYFREGFNRGYQDGFYSRFRYGSNTNGVFSLLGNILQGVFNARPY
jgi:hypothetical protein